MSRCYCCNRILTTQESVRRFKDSGEFTEMCDTCLSEIADIPTVEGEGGEDELFDDEGNPVED